MMSKIKKFNRIAFSSFNFFPPSWSAFEKISKQAFVLNCLLIKSASKICYAEHFRKQLQRKFCSFIVAMKNDELSSVTTVLCTACCMGSVNVLNFDLMQRMKNVSSVPWKIQIISMIINCSLSKVRISFSIWLVLKFPNGYVL